MASDFLSDLGKTIVDKLINGAIEESRYLFCFTGIAEDFEKEKETLEAKRKAVERKVKAAKRRVEEIFDDITDWQQQADKLIQEDTKTNVKCFFGWCPNCIWRYSRGKKLAGMTEEIQRLLTQSNNFESVGIASSLPDVEYHSFQYYIAFKSREMKHRELQEALMDDNNYMIGLQGMGGSGKTTLAKSVGRELKQSKRFDQVVDTTVSNTPDIKKIQDDLAGPLGLDLKSYNELDRPKKLWSRLTNDEKILVILDDVWEHINFEQIGIPNRDNRKGCRVLLTTRDLRVCNSMGCERTIQLELLSEEDAWILFKRHADIKDDFPKSLLQKGREIVKECKGLPVAIVAIACSLKGEQHQEEWRAALTSLRKPRPVLGVDENMVEVYTCLRYSYDNLKNEDTKRLFLLCSLFPEDEEIPVETLARLGIAAGLFGEIEDKRYDAARTQVLVAKNKLIKSGLLLKAGEKEVKMHDLVRDVAIWIANNEILQVNLLEKNQMSLIEREKNMKYLLCNCRDMDVFSRKIDSSKLEILVVNSNKNIGNSVNVPDMFFQNMTGLRVLYLSHVGARGLPLSFPLSFQSLSNIRSLYFERIVLGNISFLGKLLNLESLELIFCTIDELPCQFTELKKFRLLTLDICIFKRNNPFEVIARWSSLEELYFCGYLVLYDDSGRIPRKLDFPPLQAYHLRESHPYSIRFGDVILAKPAFKNGADSMTSVDFYNIENFFTESAFKYLVQTTEVLRTDIRGEWRNLIPEIVPMDKGMNDVVELYLRSCPNLQCLIDTRHVDSHEQNVFSKLVELDLENLENMQELCNGPYPFDFLNSLQELSISDCKQLQGVLFESKLNLCNLKIMSLYRCQMLVSLFQLSTSRSLVLLEELRISSCEQLKNIITNERSGEDGDNDDNKGGRAAMFSNLRILVIDNCPQLEFVLSEVHSAAEVPMLKYINISSCGELKYLFGNMHQDELKDVALASLEILKLSDLPNLISVFPKCYNHKSIKKNSSFSKPQIQSSSTTTTSVKSNLTPWAHICCCAKKYRQKLTSTRSTNIISTVANDQPQQCSISSASKSGGSYSYLLDRAECLSNPTQILSNIKDIRLENVSKIKSMLILSVAQMMLLETLRIDNCCELRMIVDIGDCGDNIRCNVFPKLKEVYLKGCKKLEYIFGHYLSDHHNQQEIHLHLPTLQRLQLNNMPNLIGIGPQNCCTTFPPLLEFAVKECSQIIIKSVGDFIIPLNSRQLDSTTNQLIGKEMHLVALENLRVSDCKAENIFCLNEQVIIGQPMKLELQSIDLEDLPHMIHPFVGLKNSFSFKKLMKLTIARCENLQVIFSACIVRCLPLLNTLEVTECKELKQIIEYGENGKTSTEFLSLKTCFPNLRFLMVDQCNNLECVFPVSKSDDEELIPMLEFLIIKQASQLKEVFKCESNNDDQKLVELPNLKIVMLVELSILYRAIELQTVEHRFVHNCPNLPLTSTVTLDWFDVLGLYQMNMPSHMIGKFINVKESLAPEISSKTNDDSAVEPEDQVTEADHELAPVSVNDDEASKKATLNVEKGVTESKPFPNNIPSLASQSVPFEAESEVGHKVQVAPEHELASSLVNITIEEDSKSEIKNDDKRNMEVTTTATSSTNLESVSSSVGPLVSAKHKTYSQENGDGQIAKPITKDVDIGDSQETSRTLTRVGLKENTGAISESSSLQEKDEINQLIEKDPLSAFENLLTGKIIVSSKSQSQSQSHHSFIGNLLKELKALMDSDLDHLVSHQESRSKLVSLLEQLNQHEMLLSTDTKEFVKNISNFFNDLFGKHATLQQVMKKHEQLLRSKADLLDKLSSAKSAQTRIDETTLMAKNRMQELSLKLDDLRKQLADMERQRDNLQSAVNKCEIQNKNLKDECTQGAQQSKELLLALASSEIHVQQVEGAINLAKETFPNLKSSFPNYH